MIKRFTDFLGPARLQTLFLLLAVTGLLSLILNAVNAEENPWAVPVQTVLAAVALVGAAIIIGGKMEPYERARWTAILLPAVVAFGLAATVFQSISLLLVGGGFGWIVAGLLLFRSKAPVEYKQAVRHLRKNEYAEAVKIMDGVIKDDPDDPNHYRFRAEILRVWGKLDRAKRDYVRMTEIAPDSAVAFNGLAEVNLQSGNYATALTAGQKAAELAPDEWVALYNLGMIEDRLRQSHEVIEHLSQALKLRVPDARHRLLIHLYLARAYARTGNATAATDQAAAIRKLSGGLDEWQKILASDQAETLRAAIGDDVAAAQAIADGTLDVMALAEAQKA
jgi:tetratricopeptide (TPR) repeat protein